MNKLIQGEALEEMAKLPDKSIDLILTDPPYGTTACKWDSIIPFDEMWKRLKLLRKDRTPVVLFGSEPFSSALRMSNIKEYKYDWIWNKKLAGNGILAKKQPLKIHEIVSIFYKHDYYPVKTKGIMRKKMGLKSSEITGGKAFAEETKNDEYYPKSIIEFSMGNYRRGRIHPTQKSTELMEYLIKTYTNEKETVLDFAMGSGTTGVACKQLNRDFIGIELEEKYFKIAQTRIKKAVRQDELFKPEAIQENIYSQKELL